MHRCAAVGADREVAGALDAASGGGDLWHQRSSVAVARDAYRGSRRSPSINQLPRHGSTSPASGSSPASELADGRAVVAKVHRATFMLRASVWPQSDSLAGRPCGRVLRADASGWAHRARQRLAHRRGAPPGSLRRRLRRSSSPRHGDCARGSSSTWPRPHAENAGLDSLARRACDRRPVARASRPPSSTSWRPLAGPEWIDDAARTARSTAHGHAAPRCRRPLSTGECRTSPSPTPRWSSSSTGTPSPSCPEAALVGSASVVHPVDWRLELPDPLPTLEQLDDFVARYQAARGACFDDDECSVLTAGQLWVASYGARCQHSDEVLNIFPGVDHSRGWPRLLRQLLARLSDAVSAAMHGGSATRRLLRRGDAPGCNTGRRRSRPTNREEVATKRPGICSKRPARPSGLKPPASRGRAPSLA